MIWLVIYFAGSWASPDGEPIGDSVRGRRIVWLEFVLGLQHHALVDHGVALD